MEKTNKGKIVQIIGPVVDVEFTDKLPEIYNALEIKKSDGSILVLEAAQHLGGHQVRAIALDETQGLKRGAEVIDRGSPLQVPVGEEVLGRMFNLLGQPIDGAGEIITKKPQFFPIHRRAPSFFKQSPKIEVFETGIKVIDLICPFIKGGKVGLFGGAGVGK